ncbi:daxx-like protein [Anabrus simplex]|uniref:daxx-like protein n=1 Tax=Anabrus simplex TaxID=316456 RepID=UPI0035A3163E
MRQLNKTLPLLIGVLAILLAMSEARRVSVRTRPLEEEDQEGGSQQVQYYTTQAQRGSVRDPQAAGVVLVSSDAYNGLYGRPAVRTQTDVSEQQYRTAQSYSTPRTKVKETAKQPPVQTIRNYSKVNDDGSFTFGYEAADGSFKEETRGTDCVVRGKYGYVDPDGNKREFTYVSGNPCDPNAVGQEEEEKDQPLDSGEENIPKGPLRPLRPLRPTAAPVTVAPRPTTTVFQQSYNRDEDEIDDEPQQLYTPAPPRTHYIQSTPSTSYFHQAQPSTPIRITPRPPTAASTVRSQLPATTYRPQLVQLSGTPRPSIVYASPSSTVTRPTPTASIYSSTSTENVDFNEELRKFQLENNVLTTPSPVRPVTPRYQPQTQPPQVVRQPVQAQPPQQARKVPSSDPIYSSELVFDPSTGQYNTVLYQQIAQTNSDLNLQHRLQPFVQPSQSTYYPQQYFQQQHAALLAQSQQLYAQQQQQQRTIAQQQQRYQPQLVTTTSKAPQRFPSQQTQSPPQAHFFFVAPSSDTNQKDNLAHGQIDSFLRVHNIAF